MKNTDNNNKVLPIDTKAMDEILETLYNERFPIKYIDIETQSLKACNLIAIGHHAIGTTCLDIESVAHKIAHKNINIAVVGGADNKPTKSIFDERSVMNIKPLPMVDDAWKYKPSINEKPKKKKLRKKIKKL